MKNVRSSKSSRMLCMLKLCSWSATSPTQTNHENVVCSFTRQKDYMQLRKQSFLATTRVLMLSLTKLGRRVPTSLRKRNAAVN